MRKFVRSFILILLLGLVLSGCKSGGQGEIIEIIDDNLGIVIENETNPDQDEIEESPYEEEEIEYIMAPDFTLENLSGEEVSLSDHKGKIVFVNFWASWCFYCEMEMPDLQLISQENEDLVILAVNEMEERSLIEDYLSESQYNFPILLDEKGKLLDLYPISGYPTTFFIDGEGHILGQRTGALDYDEMNQILDLIRNFTY